MTWCHLVARVSPLTLVIVDSSPKLRSMIAPTASPGVRWWWEIGNPHLQNKSCVCLASIWGGSWRPLWNSHAYLVFQVHPCVSDLQGGYEGELLEIEMQGFLDYLQNRAQMFENILTSLYKFFSEYGVQIEIGAKSHFLLFTALPRNGLRKLLNIFPSSWKSSVGKFLIVLWCTLVHFLLPEETGNTFWQTLKSSKTCTQSSTSDDLLL